MIVAAGANRALGNQGLFVLALLAGLLDVDAISLSCASMVTQGQLSIAAAADAVLIATAANTILKPLIVMKVGDLRMGWRVIAATAAAFAGAGAGLWQLAR
jgi:uncharacterized membrane protein (DUF4010 family)